MARIVVCAPDLMDQSKIRAAAESLGAGAAPTFVRAPRLVETVRDDAEAEVIIVDLSRAGVLELIGQVREATVNRPAGLRIVGFGSHVDRALLDEARTAGCDEVLVRSAFFGDLAAALA